MFGLFKYTDDYLEIKFKGRNQVDNKIALGLYLFIPVLSTNTIHFFFEILFVFKNNIKGKMLGARCE